MRLDLLSGKDWSLLGMKFHIYHLCVFKRERLVSEVVIFIYIFCLLIIMLFVRHLADSTNHSCSDVCQRRINVTITLWGKLNTTWPTFSPRIDFLKTLHVISLKYPAPNSIIKTLCSRLSFLFRGWWRYLS